MAWRDRTRPALLRLRRALPVVIVAIIANFALARFGVLHGLEHWVTDIELKMWSQTASAVAIVTITDEDYDEIFNGRSPLDPDRLHELIAAIDASAPRVIGVDIDTTHEDFRRFTVDPGWRARIIWEREISTRGMQGGAIEPLDVLGGRDPSRNASSGIPVLLDDPEDKVTRLYTRCVDTKVGPQPSFVYASVQAYRNPKAQDIARSCRGQDADEPKFIRSFRQSQPLRAGHVLAKARSSKDTEPDPELHDKLVLIGGTYRDFDRHFTPGGSQPGVVILANAIETELKGGGAAVVPRWKLFALEFVASAILICLFHAASVRTIVIYGIPAALVVSVAFSTAIFQSSSRLFSFAPTLLAVLAFEIYEHIRHKAILDAFSPSKHDKPKRRKSRHVR